MQQISIRKFPYPYKAALAIANDIDNTPSLEIFLEFMKYLNSSQNTKFGPGLDLEFSSSFWFFNNTQSEQLSYFSGLSNNKTEFAPFCRELWKSGHIDSFHTYGNFDDGGFQRQYAEQAFEELDKHSVRLKTWINHGNPNNHQNIGLADGFEGAKPDTQNYHFDLMKNHGLRYVWSGKMTHVLGQNADKTVNVIFKNKIQQLLLKTRYKNTEPKPFYLDNNLVNPINLQDGNKVMDFQRFVNLWGKEQEMDCADLGSQLRPKNIRQLIKNQGFLVVYTHMCEGLYSPAHISDSLQTALQFIKEKTVQQELLVASNTRLLTYFDLVQNIAWREETSGELTKIHLENRSEWNIIVDDLQGLTFYCECPEKTRLVFENEEIICQVNPPDLSGKPSISVPWRKLEYPEF